MDKTGEGARLTDATPLSNQTIDRNNTASQTLALDATGASQHTKRIYTKLFFQRPLSYRQAVTWLFMRSLIFGTAYGYFWSVQISIQEKGATFKDQSTLSIAFYPNSFKFLLAPILDSFFSVTIGKSKTYYLLGTFLTGLFFLYLTFSIQDLIDRVKVVYLTIIFFTINTLLSVSEIAGDAWCLTLFSDSDRAKVPTFQSLGQALGITIAYNFFTPFNDVAWLNEKIFYDNPVDQPLLTHGMYCMFVCALFAAQFTVVLLWVAEDITNVKDATDIVTFGDVLKVLPRHFSNKYMRSLVFYMFACRMFYYMIESTFDLMLLKNGHMNIRRSFISNVDLFMFPLVFLASYCTVYYLHVGRLIRTFHLFMFVVVTHGLFRLVTVLDLIESRNSERTLIARGLTSLVYGMDFSTYFLSSFFYSIVNPKIGNTGMTCLISLMNQTLALSQTVGLYLADYVEYKLLVGVCLITQFTLLVLLFPFASTFDKLDYRLFDLSEPPSVIYARLKPSEDKSKGKDRAIKS